MRRLLSKLASRLFTRNSALFGGGLAGVAHETLLTHAERPTLLILFAAMMGLPAFLSSPDLDHRKIEEKRVQELERTRLEQRIKEDQEALERLER